MKINDDYQVIRRHKYNTTHAEVAELSESETITSIMDAWCLAGSKNCPGSECDYMRTLIM